MAQALHGQTQDVVAHFRFNHAAHNIAFSRPKMQQAFIMIVGERESRLRQIEGNGAVFDNHGILRSGEKLLHCAYESLTRHLRILSNRSPTVCDG